jgi:hypothetical protein
MFDRIVSKFKWVVGTAMVSVLPSVGGCQEWIQDILNSLGGGQPS